jgi:glycosyltransferase involved in cell wall biosynthesis
VTPLRILYVADRFRPYIGGIEVIAARLLPELTARGHEIAVATLRGRLPLSAEEYFGDIAVHRFLLDDLPAARQLDMIAAARARFRALLRTFSPHVIHLNGLPSLFFTLVMAGQMDTGSRILWSLHSELAPSRMAIPPSTLQALERAAWVAACSEAVLDEARQIVPSIRARSSILPGVLLRPMVIPSPLSFDPPTLLGMARLVPQKGMDLLIDAFAVLRTRFPDARLVVAGDGEARADLERQAARLSVADSTTFTGWVTPDGIWPLIDAATLVVIPSREEGFGMTALEAAVMARPVVAAAVGGLPEALDYGAHGVLVPPEHVDALAGAIASLLEHPDRARALGEHARVHTQDRFAPAVVAGTYESLYARVATQRYT